MGSATSSIPAEPIVAAAAVVGALGYGYVQFTRSAAHSESTATSTLHGQKKRGRKLQLPGDATLKNADILDVASIPGSLSASSSASGTGTRQRRRQEQSQLQQQSKYQETPTAQQSLDDAVPGGFDGAVASAGDVRDASQQRGGPPQRQRQPQQPEQQQQQQHVSTAAKRPKKKKGKKAVPSEPGASSLAASTSTEGGVTRSEAAAPTGKGKRASMPASANAADSADERWTRVEARKKKPSAPLQDSLAKLEMADVTTSDAGITTSVTGNSSPVTERTTEDELPPEVEECVFLPPFVCVSYLSNTRAIFLLRGIFCLQERDGGVVIARCSASRPARSPAAWGAAREGLYVGGL